MRLIFLVFAFCILWINNFPVQEKKDNVIQFDINKILNARPISTLTNNKLVTWTKGIDGNGIGDGYLTLSTALSKGDKDPHALPDDPLFPANGSHPEIQLHYSNADSLHNQATAIPGAGSVAFNVPKDKYTSVYLALTSAEGPSALKIQLSYSNGIEIKDFLLPDYYQDLPLNDSSFCYLAHDLAKWGNKNNMTEKDHHNIDLLKVRADPNRVLKSIIISKNKPGYLVFWAAVGVRFIEN